MDVSADDWYGIEYYNIQCVIPVRRGAAEPQGKPGIGAVSCTYAKYAEPFVGLRPALMKTLVRRMGLRVEIMVNDSLRIPKVLTVPLNGSECLLRNGYNLTHDLSD
jgi:hypothetical protein